MTTNEPIMLEAILTRVGLNYLVNSPHGVKKLVTHVGLSPDAFAASTDTLAVPNELHRWPVIDGEEIGSNQINLYIEFPWDGEDAAVRSLGFYSEDGVLLAVYSAPKGTVEAYLVKHTLLDTFYSLSFDAAPANSISVENTGYRFNPGIRELLVDIQAQISDMRTAAILAMAAMVRLSLLDLIKRLRLGFKNSGYAI